MNHRPRGNLLLFAFSVGGESNEAAGLPAWISNQPLLDFPHLF